MPGTSSLAIIIDGAPHLSPELLKELYRITGRPSVDLRAAILVGEEVYSAELFGTDHVGVVPRLEKTIAFCERHSLSFRIEETYDGETEEITLATMREILESGAEGL